MFDNYIMITKDDKDQFLTFFIVNKSDKFKAFDLVKYDSHTENVSLIKALDIKELATWQSALKENQLTAKFTLNKGTCLDLAIWAH